MRGSPQIGFSRLILRISLRTSFDSGGGRVGRGGPSKSKTVGIPAVARDDGIRFDDVQNRAPLGPGFTKPAPQAPVESIQLRLLHRTLQHAKLMAESPDLELQYRSSAKGRQRGGEHRVGVTPFDRHIVLSATISD
jgi:hypothetical protein